MERNAKIYIAGHKGLVFSHSSTLEGAGIRESTSANIRELDLTDHRTVRKLFFEERPDYVILAAAKVGGILAKNTFQPNSFTKTFLSRRMSSMKPTSTEFNAFCFLDRVVSIRSKLLSQSMKARSLAVH